MQQIARPDLSRLLGWVSRRTATRAHVPCAPESQTRHASLLRRFCALGLVSICLISLGLAAILSHFMQREILAHDAELTKQFIDSVARTQASEANIAAQVTFGQLLDERSDLSHLGVDPFVARGVRSQFYDHLRYLPDALLSVVIAPDRTILWSSNRALVGTQEQDSEELSAAFGARSVATMRPVGSLLMEPQTLFTRQPEGRYVENYAPMTDARGSVMVVVKIYKEPASLVHALHYGQLLVWTSIIASAALLCLALFCSIRRADALLHAQRERLLEMEALCVIGEMSAAVAHGIRNPLASIRSSAELSLDGSIESARRNSANIITQIDRLGKWVRDLLVFSRPLLGENQNLDLVLLIEEGLHCFTHQLEQARVVPEFVRPGLALPPVVGNFALASQTLAIILSNAIEAMPEGGSLRLEIQTADLPGRMRLDVVDSGSGISAAEMDLIFKPYYTTKRNGLGLGMALAKRIMERFDGAIRLHSHKGAGTRVSLLFKVV